MQKLTAFAKQTSLTFARYENLLTLTIKEKTLVVFADEEANVLLSHYIYFVCLNFLQQTQND